jgi:hypothetical protein
MAKQNEAGHSVPPSTKPKKPSPNSKKPSPKPSPKVAIVRVAKLNKMGKAAKAASAPEAGQGLSVPAFRSKKKAAKKRRKVAKPTIAPEAVQGLSVPVSKRKKKAAAPAQASSTDIAAADAFNVSSSVPAALLTPATPSRGASLTMAHIQATTHKQEHKSSRIPLSGTSKLQLNTPA